MSVYICMTKQNPLTELIEELFSSTSVEKRCPYIQKDEKGPYCSKGLTESQEISQKRRMVCDHFSLQLWCLDYSRYDLCIFYQGEKID